MADERDPIQQQQAADAEPPAVSEQEAAQALTEGAEESVAERPADETMVELPPSGEEQPPADAPSQGEESGAIDTGTSPETPLSAPPPEPPPVEAGPPAAPAVQEGPAPDAPPIDEGPPSPLPGRSPLAAQQAVHEEAGHVDEHPEYFIGGVFAAGFVLAQILKRIGNG